LEENIVKQFNIQFDLGSINLTVNSVKSFIISNLANQVKLYPNPSKGEFIIETPESLNIQIFDVSGRIVLNNELIQGVNNVNMKTQTPGIYFVRLFNTEESTNLRLIIE
ncbi:MAG: T9SS type A sorting domain-containing protein, partial [Bacteroidales bacterium]|nr:T9SS type A sorting domain-containing protein [Bacteroidales bacterium]